jgi:hypothetical protein
MFSAKDRFFHPLHRCVSERIAGLGAVLVTGTTLAAFPASAQEVTYPWISGELEIEMENDLFFGSNDPDADIDSLYPTAALAAEIGLTSIFSINLGLTLEQVVEPTGDNYFQDIGLYMDTINLQAEVGNATFIAGKFAPTFGNAWDVTPGIYGTVLAEDYEVTEMIGFGLAYEFDAGSAGKHTLQGNTFFVDTTFLSESLFTNRGQVSLSDGGPANTGQFNNFTVTLDGEKMAALSGLSYSLGFAWFSAGEGDIADETGYSFALVHESEFDNGLSLALNGEIAYFNNAGGTLDDATYFTAGAELSGEHWHGELAGAIRNTSFDGGGSENTSLIQASGGYEFDNGLDLSLGYAYVDDAGTTSHVFGIHLCKSLEFASPNAPEEDIELPERPRERGIGGIVR